MLVLYWVFRSRATSGRTWFCPEGNDHYRFVKDGNGLASRTSAMVLLASAMGLIWMVEQPKASILEAHERINSLWHTITAYKAKLWMGCFNGPTPKPHYILTNSKSFSKGMDFWFNSKIGMFLFFTLEC